MAEAALALSEQKAQGLGELLATAVEEQRSLAERQADEHRLEQQVSREGWARGGRAVPGRGDGGALALPLPQAALERESKLLRDLSAANEKTLLLRNQVRGVRGWARGGGGAAHPSPGLGCPSLRAPRWLRRWTSWSGR